MTFARMGVRYGKFQRRSGEAVHLVYRNNSGDRWRFDCRGVAEVPYTVAANVPDATPITCRMCVDDDPLYWPPDRVKPQHL